jgi:hypothetical protein
METSMYAARLLLTCAFSAMLAGCGAMERAAQDSYMAKTPASAWGSPPFGYEAKLIKLMKDSLIDPDSARFKFSKPDRISWPSSKGGQSPAWQIDVLVNAKNSFGGYTGDQLWRFAQVREEGGIYYFNSPPGKGFEQLPWTAGW